jgi:hypothetical protein
VVVPGHNLGTAGLNAQVNAIAIDPGTGNIYVGGAFTNIDGVATNKYLVRWDVSANAGAGGWVNLNTAMDNNVQSLYISKRVSVYRWQFHLCHQAYQCRQICRPHESQQ